MMQQVQCQYCRAVLGENNQNLVSNLNSQKIKYSQKCDHHLCQLCFDKLYFNFQVQKRKCDNPDCQQQLKYGNFLNESKEDLQFKKDKEIRKEILSIYNKQLSDFDNNFDLYDDYLFEIENKIDILMKGTPEQQAIVRKEMQKEIKNDREKKIDTRNLQKKQLEEQMKIIEQFQNKEIYTKMNPNFKNQVNQSQPNQPMDPLEEANNLDIEKNELKIEEIQNFLKIFSLDSMNDLREWRIHQLLDKQKYLAERMKKQYYIDISQGVKCLAELITNKPYLKNQSRRSNINITNQEQLVLKQKCAFGYFTANTFKNNEENQVQEIKINNVEYLRDVARQRNQKNPLQMDQPIQSMAQPFQIDNQEVYKQRCRDAFERNRFYF